MIPIRIGKASVALVTRVSYRQHAGWVESNPPVFRSQSRFITKLLSNLKPKHVHTRKFTQDLFVALKRIGF